MCHADKEKRKTANGGRNGITKWRKIRTVQEMENYKYLGILEANAMKHTEMKEKIKKEYFGRTRKQLETKLRRRNLIKRINTCAIPLVKYSRLFLKWTKEELQKMDQRIRKLITMHKDLHPRDDTDELYVSRKEGGRGLSSIEDKFNTSIRCHGDNKEKSKERLI